MKKYRRISWPDRLDIEKLYNSGLSLNAIARKLGFSVSSIHAEVHRGLYDHLDYRTWKTEKYYSAQIADDEARWQSTSKGRPIKLADRYDYVSIVASRLHGGESPDQIVGDLKRKGQWTVCTATLYDYIEKGYIPGVSVSDLYAYRYSKKRKKKKQGTHRTQRAPKGNIIDRRPAEIGSRTTFGHWEVDTVIGRKKGTGQALLVMTERLTRYEVIVKLRDKTAKNTAKAIQKAAKMFPRGTFKSITVDNGVEFQDYEGMSEVAPVYYCHPYSSWERGSNENANRLIRRFFPKGQSMKHRTQKDCDAAALFINRMHRKTLNYATAEELFMAHLAAL